MDSGAHVFLRKFEFIDACPRNRRAYNILFLSQFQHLAGPLANLSASDIHQCHLLLCPDFPLSLVHSVTALLEKKDNSLLFEFEKYRQCFPIYFFYQDFISESQEVIKKMDGYRHGKASKTMVYINIKNIVEEKGHLFECPPIEVLDSIFVHSAALLGAHVTFAAWLREFLRCDLTMMTATAPFSTPAEVSD